MPVPNNKKELQIAIKNNYDKLKKELSDIPTEKTKNLELEGHTKGKMMSINHVISYLIGWGELVLKWNWKKTNNEPVEFPEVGFKWNELGKLAQKFYEDYKNDDFLELRKKLDENVVQILALVESKSNAELYEMNWYGKWTLGRMIQFNSASPYTNARGRIRKWKKEKNIK